MEYFTAVHNRYSCKNFNPDCQITEDQLQMILSAGQAAPTAKNLQEQHIYVLQSPEMLAAVDRITPCRYKAPTVLAVAWDATNVFTYPGGTRDSGAEDASIVATHLMLAATACGVDSCWLNFFDPAIAKKELSLPDNEELLMLLDLGYAAEGSRPLPNHYSRKDLTQTVTRL